MTIRIKKIKVKLFFISLMVFLISLILAPYYINGDQSSYIRVYSELPLLSFMDGFQYYRKYLTASEIIPFILMYLSSMVMEKTLYVAIFNTILSYLILIFLTRLNVNLIVSSTIVLSNFYLYVVYFAAERLKFGIIFFMISLLYMHIRRHAIIYLFLSIQSHLQMTIIYLSLASRILIQKLLRLFVFYKLSRLLAGLVLLLVLLLFLFNSVIIHKLTTYMSLSSGLLGLWKGFVFFLLALFYSNNKRETISIFFTLLVFTYFLGGDRINMFSFFVFTYYALQVNRGINFGILVSILYMMYKSVFFIENIINYGNGFY